MATIFLDINETNFNIANDGNSIFGQQGTESVNILSGVTGTVLDANIDQVSLAGNVSDFLFQQQGNQLLVYKDNILVVTSIVQTDEDGSLLTFENGTFSAKFGQGAVIEIGGTPVPDDEPGEVIPGDDPSEPFTDVDIDTIAFPTQADFDAAGGAYNFIDDAAFSNYAVIVNFSADDTILFVNAVVDDYTFSNEGEDVTLSYNYQDDGIMNVITLTGVVSNDALVYDLASFTDAVGFDAFG